MSQKQDHSGRGKGGRKPSRPHGGRPTSKEAEQLYERILDAAIELFTANGYGETSIESIAARAGVGKLTLYRRFFDKETLFQAVALRLSELRRGEMAGLTEHEGTLAEVLTIAGKQLLNIALSPQSVAFHRILYAEAARLPELAARMYQDVPVNDEAELKAPIRAVLRQFADQGALRIEDVAFLDQQFIQYIIGRPLQNALLGRAPMTARERDLYVRCAVDLFLHGAAAS